MNTYLIPTLILLTLAPFAALRTRPPAAPAEGRTATTAEEQLPYGTGYEARERLAQGEQQRNAGAGGVTQADAARLRNASRSGRDPRPRKRAPPAATRSGRRHSSPAARRASRGGNADRPGTEASRPRHPDSPVRRHEHESTARLIATALVMASLWRFRSRRRRPRAISLPASVASATAAGTAGRCGGRTLKWMREEEKLARDMYLTLNRTIPRQDLHQHRGLRAEALRRARQEAGPVRRSTTRPPTDRRIHATRDCRPSTTSCSPLGIGRATSRHSRSASSIEEADMTDLEAAIDGHRQRAAGTDLPAPADGLRAPPRRASPGCWPSR